MRGWADRRDKGSDERYDSDVSAIDVATDLRGSEGLIRRLRRVEYDWLIEAGHFDRDKLELIRGVLVRKTPQGVLTPA